MKMRTFFRQYMMVTFIIIVAAFIIVSILGYFGMLKFADTAQDILDQFRNMIEKQGIMDDEGNASCVKLFLNNFRATGMAAILGIVPFLFLPVLVLISNGAIMGAMFSILAHQGAPLWKYFAAGILPHGIFEIPAICLGITLGFQLCRFICCKILDRGKLGSLKAGTFFINELKLFVFVATPLLIIAAVVEAYITPIIMNAVI